MTFLCLRYFNYYYFLDSSDSDSSSASDKSKDRSTISPPAPIPNQHNATATTTGQLISKQDSQAITSPKKRTLDFCPGALLLQG